MNKLLLVIGLLILCFSAQAQRIFGNEWIKPNQKYLKIVTTQTGLYRLTYADLTSADSSFRQTNPARWQLFFRGKEMAIRIVGQQDGSFDAQDYVEFYGEGNDGSQDSLLYRPQQRLHPYQTLFSDKTAYFLTVSPTQSGKRVPELTLPTQGSTPVTYHLEETVKAFTSEYTFNNLKGIEPALQQSYFEPGEGWSGTLLTADTVGVVPLSFSNRIASSTVPISLTAMINGRDNVYHQVQLKANASLLTTLSFSLFTPQTFQTTLSANLLQNEQLTLQFQSAKLFPTNNYSVSYVRVTYPQALDMAGAGSKVFHIPAIPNQVALLSLQNVPQGALAYDITDKANARFMALQSAGGQTQVVIDQANSTRNVFISSQFLKPVTIQRASFKASFPATANYLIITHASLRQSAETYASYRASSAGGSYTPFIVEADSLYDQFNYGERSPLALRRFLDFMLANSAVKNLLLIGRACSYPYYIKTTTTDLVPTIGYPGSDILLSAGLNGYSVNTPALPTGRLNVTTNDQVLAYLAKVKQFETATPNGLWRKQLVHISGGKTVDEALSLRNDLSTIATTFTNGQLGGQVNVFSKSTTDEVQNINITPLVNNGVSMITFFGHAGPAVTDMNFGFASPPENGFNNSLYPFMFFNGCGVGEIFSNFNTLSTDWLLAPNKGAAVVMAHSYWSFEAPTVKYLTKLYSILFNDPASLGMPYGKVQQNLNAALEQGSFDSYDVSVLLETILQGDPAISLYPLPNPDYAIDTKGLYIQSSVPGASLGSSDSIQVVIPLANWGKFTSGQVVSVALKKTSSTGAATIPLQIGAFRYQDTLRYRLPKDPNLQRLDVVIDPANQLTELSKSNNTGSLSIDWTQANSSSSYPAALLPDRIPPQLTIFIDGTIPENPAVVGIKPRVDVFVLDENPLAANDVSAIDVYLKSCATCSPQQLSSSVFSVSAVAGNQLRITTTLSLQAGTTYELIVFGKDAAGNRTQSPYIIELTTVSDPPTVSLATYPNPATTYVKFDLNLNVSELPIESKLVIYTLSGAQLFSDTLSVATGKNVFFWQGPSPGVYPYSIQLTWKNGKKETYSGKVIWQP